MDATLAIAAPWAPVGRYLTQVLDTQADWLVLTRDGTPGGSLIGVLGRRDLVFAEGASPLAICEQMARADHIGALARLRQEGEQAIAAGLTGPDAMRWLAPIAGAFHAAVLRQVVALVEGALANEGLGEPALDHCWVFFGSAAREELLTRHDLDHGLVYGNPSNPTERRQARAYFLELGRRVSAGLVACGYASSTKGIVAGHPSACRSAAEWERAFSSWVAEPAESGVYRATSFFDMRPIHGDCRLVERLQRHIHNEEAQNPGFVPLLVSDSLANLPPLTFFRGLVIDDDGAYTETLDLQRATLQPVVDLSRALALDCRVYQSTATLDRLRALAPADGEAAALIDETAAAFTTALYQRLRSALTTGSEGSRVDPAKLTRLEQNMLKSGFRTVLRLMEYMGARYGIAPRR
jgi:CBS domain-containing protein